MIDHAAAVSAGEADQQTLSITTRPNVNKNHEGFHRQRSWRIAMCRRIIVAIILFASTGCSVLRRAENAMELLATANQRLAEANQRMAETNQRLDMVQAKLDET